MRTRVKICGITRIEDARAAAAAGADAIGLVFHPGSPRVVDIDQAVGLCRALPPFVSVVALFVNERPQRIRDVLAAVPVDLLQFHGSERADQCEGFGRPYIKAIAMKEGVDVEASLAQHPRAAGFLFDAWLPDLHGGGGVTFDWSRMPALVDRPAILAGGLDPDNVAEAIQRTRPWAVDVSSGVEQDKGIKSAGRIEAFMRGVRRGDSM
ncbi:MAG TPA: phosphoribosylanthranilate isomerase [Gammaproteobacteria bacterium]|nr:phosphoribosylanthranilate isomerase [Gammaproteobacteria bacterium]